MITRELDIFLRGYDRCIRFGARDDELEDLASLAREITVTQETPVATVLGEMVRHINARLLEVDEDEDA